MTVSGYLIDKRTRKARQILPSLFGECYKSDMSEAKEIKLEDALKRLAEIVKSLEQNECSLEQSLQFFEEGVTLTRACHLKLTEAERRIEILTKVTADGVETKPLDSE